MNRQNGFTTLERLSWGTGRGTAGDGSQERGAGTGYRNGAQTGRRNGAQGRSAGTGRRDGSRGLGTGKGHSDGAQGRALNKRCCCCCWHRDGAQGLGAGTNRLVEHSKILVKMFDTATNRTD